MSIIAKEPENTGNFEQVPPGTYQAVCYGVWDLGIQVSNWEGEEKKQHKIIVAWEVNETMKNEGEYQGKRFTISKRYTLSLADRANLRKDLDSWRGRPFNELELQGFDVETIIGANCILGIIHKESGEKTYANISSISSTMKGQEKMIAENNNEAPEWVQKIQAKAVPIMTGTPGSIGMSDNLDETLDPFSG